MGNMTYEEAVKQLEKKIICLEKGEMSLDDMLKLYDEAVKLSGYCEALLNSAKIKMNELDLKGDHANE